ncbi:hypothetical protein V6N13_146976 [Hibiscus sabdariffa]
MPLIFGKLKAKPKSQSQKQARALYTAWTTSLVIGESRTPNPNYPTAQQTNYKNNSHFRLSFSRNGLKEKRGRILPRVRSFLSGHLRPFH